MNSALVVAGVCALLCVFGAWFSFRSAQGAAEKLIAGVALVFMLLLYFVLWFNAGRGVQ